STGLLPLQGATFMATLTKHVREVPISPARRRPELEIPPALDALVMRCLAKRPADRPRDAATLRTELAVIDDQLRARASRLPSALAASETMDLGASAIARSAVEAEVGRATPALRPASPASDTFGSALRAARRRRRRLFISAAIGVGAAIALLAVRAGSTDRAPVATLSAASPPVPDAAAGADAAPSAPAAPAAIDAMAPPPPDAAAPRPTPRPPRNPHKQAIADHFAQAAAARAAGNRLKEIAALDAILHLDRHNRRALYELGEALVRAGDKGRGCGYLRRAGGYRDAARRIVDAGCPTPARD
ncbi:MAG TPA: hypothetical protein VML75_27895, partial [Kofleriaceae bacterium]|nr:hypothetical protein [Kofleriaceae bacterium]